MPVASKAYASSLPSGHDDGSAVVRGLLGYGDVERGGLHRKVGELRLHRRAQALGGVPPLKGQLRRPRADAGQQLALLGLQRLGPLAAVGDAVQLGGGLLPETEHLLDGCAVLAFQLPHRLQPVFDLPEAGRVGVHAVTVGLQGAGELLRLDDEGLGVLPQRRGGLVHLREARDGLGGGAQAVHGGGALVALVKGVVGLGGEGLQALGVGGDGALGLEALVLAGLQARRDNLVGLEAEQVGAAGELAFVRPQSGELLPRGAQPADGVGDPGGLRLQPGETVENGELRADVEERELLALAVDVDEPLAEGGQHAEGDDGAVDAADVAALMVDLPRDDDLPCVVGGEAGLLQHLAGGAGLGGGEGEEALDAGLAGLGADQALLGALAEQQADGVDDDGLARARLARQDVEAGSKGELQAVYERVVRDGQDVQHVLVSRACRLNPTWRARGWVSRGGSGPIAVTKRSTGAKRPATGAAPAAGRCCASFCALRR